MKKYWRMLCLLLAACLTLGSCMSSEVPMTLEFLEGQGASWNGSVAIPLKRKTGDYTVARGMVQEDQVVTLDWKIELESGSFLLFHRLPNGEEQLITDQPGSGSASIQAPTGENSFELHCEKATMIMDVAFSARPADLSSDLLEAMKAGTAEEFCQEQAGHIVLEKETETEHLEYVDRFYSNYLHNVPDDIYIGRYGDPEYPEQDGQAAPVVYHLVYNGGDTYELSLTTEATQTKCTLREIVKTDREYVFTTDSTVSPRAAEVGFQGLQGLTIHNLCEHQSWEHTIVPGLIQLVGEEPYQQWYRQNASRTQCKRNLYQFLQDFYVGYEDFLTAIGQEHPYHLDVAISIVYPYEIKVEKPEEASSAASASESEPSAPVSVPVITGDHFLGDVETGIIDEINAERASLGLSELKYDERLRSAARIRSQELYESGVWAHTRPNGDPWQTVLQRDIPVQYVSAGENLATVQYNDPSMSFESDPHWWFEEWKNSPTHYENICREEFDSIGVGVYCVKLENNQVIAYATTTFAHFDA